VSHSPSLLLFITAGPVKKLCVGSYILVRVMIIMSYHYVAYHFVHIFVNIHSMIIMFGANESTFKKKCDDAHIWENFNHMWTINPSPFPYTGHFHIQDKIYFNILKSPLIVSDTDTRACMLDRAGAFDYGREEIGTSNDLLRFSTTALRWEQLSTTQVSGSPPSPRYAHVMVAAGGDLFIFGGLTAPGVFTPDGPSLASNDFFRFSSTALQWEQLGADKITDPPNKRSGHGMVVVGGDLFVFGGSTSIWSLDPPESEDLCADLLVYSTHRVIAWPAFGFSAAWFSRVYEGDIIQVTGEADWPSGCIVELCVSVLPCSLTIVGNPSASSTIRRHTNSRIVCEAASGCTGVTVRHVSVTCTREISAVGALQISGAGAVATIERVAISDCASEADGGSIRAYNGAAVKISGTTFQRSSSQVPFKSCHSCHPLTPLPSVLLIYVNTLFVLLWFDYTQSVYWYMFSDHSRLMLFVRPVRCDTSCAKHTPSRLLLAAAMHHATQSYLYNFAVLTNSKRFLLAHAPRETEEL
jgi:hypothetical protein